MSLSKKWRLSAFDYHVDHFLVPVLIAIAAGWGPISFSQLMAGIVSWSFIEYVVHRFLFHRKFRRDHWAHHVNPLQYIGISGVQIAIGLSLLLPVAHGLELTSVYCGALMGYFCYLTAHFAIHRPDSWLFCLFRGLAKNHDLHHRKGVEKNFGVTSPLWDCVFGTYLGSRRT